MAKGYRVNRMFSSCMIWSLRFSSFIVFLAAIAAVALTFAIKVNPSIPAGWGLIALGVVAAVSGILGMCSVGDWGFCGCHLLFSLLSTAGLAVSSAIIFISPSRALDGIKYDNSKSNAKRLLLVVAGLHLMMLVLHLLKFFLSCCIQSCFLNNYEDLEKQQPSERELAKEQKRAEKQKAKIEGSKAHQVAEEMKEKYGFSGGA